MRISVFGLGYVGCVSAACLAKEGHEVVGVDVNQDKVDMINAGRSPIIEKGLDELLQQVTAPGCAAGRLSATADSRRAVADTEVSMICVGTPSRPSGDLSLDYVRNCAREIGQGLHGKDDYHVVVTRSTMLPMSVEEVVVPEVEVHSSKRAGDDFGAVMNPEFLREGTSMHDFYDPPMTVIGQLDQRSGDTVEAVYHFLTAPVVRTEIRTAEMVKYACNAFHALKVSFANEIGAICKTLEIDSHAVMDIFCMDKKLNLSSYYLKPGFAFGGSCLPKDLRAVNYQAKRADVDAPLLRSIMESNRVHLERAVDHIVALGKRRVGILGLSFKAGTDDLRESPMVTLTETLIGKGFELKIYDRSVSLARLVGANKDYIEHQIPHISSLMCDDIEEIVGWVEVLVVGNRDDEFAAALTRSGTSAAVYDLVRILDSQRERPEGYEGICW